MTHTAISGQRVEFEVEEGTFCEHNQWPHDCRECGTRTYDPQQGPQEDLSPMTPEHLDAAHYQYAPSHDAIVTADDIQSDRNSYNAEAYADLHDAGCECDDCYTRRDDDTGDVEEEDALAMQPAYLPCKHCRTLTFAPQLRDGCCEACNYGDGYLTCECEVCVGIREWEAMGGRGVPVRPELQALAKHLETHPCRVFGINVSTIKRALAGAAIIALALSPHAASAREDATQGFLTPPSGYTMYLAFEDHSSLAYNDSTGEWIGFDPDITGTDTGWHMTSYTYRTER